MTQLAKKYRPKDFDEMVGQNIAVKMLKGFLEKKKVPHAIMLTGNSGTGKTTTARILRRKLFCKGNIDYKEINCATERGIDMVRELGSHTGAYATEGKCKVWFLDECQALSKDAMQALLIMVENTPDHLYWIFGTSDPQKIIKAIMTRCTVIPMAGINNAAMEDLIGKILKAENATLDNTVFKKIVEVSEGSARQAINFLEKCLQLDSIEDIAGQIAVLEAGIGGSVTQGIDLIRFLFKCPQDLASFTKAMKIVKGFAKDDIEGVRQGALGYVAAILQNGVSGNLQLRCLRVIRAFRDNFYESGKAGLIAAVFEVSTGGDLP